ncbi:MAG: riboflavin synthase [Candidatus Acidiferrales bacterium]|jgi:riboflavin synthase
MFTGITEQVGKIESLEHSKEGGRLRIGFCGTATPGCGLGVDSAPSSNSDIASTTKLGDSISVNGCCLTVVEFTAAHFSADLSGETLRRTNFGEKRPGHLVNLERPLAAGARLGGHFMQGHVDGIGRVTRLVPEGENWWLSVRVPEDLRRYVAEKGSIAIDGISLTVARWHDGIADIAIIPFTYAHTNVQAMTVNDAVNVEADILAKYVESLLHQEKSPATSHLSVKHLIEEGF